MSYPAFRLGVLALACDFLSLPVSAPPSITPSPPWVKPPRSMAHALMCQTLPALHAALRELTTVNKDSVGLFDTKKIAVVVEMKPE